MRIFSTIQISIKAMLANKLRTMLTVLGMVIGIASVIIVYSAGSGIESLILGQIESFGTDIVQTEIKVPNNKKGIKEDTQSSINIATGIQVTTLNLDDAEEIKKLSNIKDGYAAIIGQEQVSFHNENKKTMLLGVSSSYIDIDKSEIDYGRFFTENEDKSLSKVVVIGSKIKEKLFGQNNPIGKFIKIKKTKFKVIGVIKEKGAVMIMDFDDFIYVPIRTLQKRILGINYIMYTVHQLEDLSIGDKTAEDIRMLLRERHNIIKPDIVNDISRDDFRVTTMSEMMDMLGTVTGAITLLLLAIVAVSLVVGGVGIMNIMYVVISERTGEIGLRKAVGASNSDIVKQFLIESILITLTGGMIGILLGILISYFIYLGANYFGLDWRFKIPIKAYFVSLGFSTFFGIVFGVYPAKKASKLEPVEALNKL